jgi:hypothetical protein
MTVIEGFTAVEPGLHRAPAAASDVRGKSGPQMQTVLDFDEKAAVGSEA